MSFSFIGINGLTQSTTVAASSLPSAFVEAVDDQNRQKYETLYQDPTTGVRVDPICVATG